MLFDSIWRTDSAHAFGRLRQNIATDTFTTATRFSADRARRTDSCLPVCPPTSHYPVDRRRRPACAGHPIVRWPSRDRSTPGKNRNKKNIK